MIWVGIVCILSVPLVYNILGFCRPRWLSQMRVRLVIRRLWSPTMVSQHSFVEINHEMFSMVILSLQLIQEEQLSVSDKKICTSNG